MRKRVLSYIWAVLFVLSITMFTNGITANAASPKAVKTVTVWVVKSVRYKSNKPKIVAVSKKGKMTAKKKEIAKIQITVTGKTIRKNPPG